MLTLLKSLTVGVLGTFILIMSAGVAQAQADLSDPATTVNPESPSPSPMWLPPAVLASVETQAQRLARLKVEAQQLEVRAAAVAKTPVTIQTLATITEVEADIARTQAALPIEKNALEWLQFFVKDLSENGRQIVEAELSGLKISPAFVMTRVQTNAYGRASADQELFLGTLGANQPLLYIGEIDVPGWSMVWIPKTAYAFVFSKDITFVRAAQ